MAAKRKASFSFHRDALVLCRSLTHDLFDLYRPELHYMRGPGPKWREKHAIEATAARFEPPMAIKTAS
jgi:hypothetical protein